jgi:hypothetical protein
VGFPPHPRGWLSIVVYQLVNDSFRDFSRVMANSASRCLLSSPPSLNKNSRATGISMIFRQPGCLKETLWAFRPILTDG